MNRTIFGGAYNVKEMLDLTPGYENVWGRNNGIFITKLKNEPAPGNVVQGTAQAGRNLVLFNGASTNTLVHEAGHILNLPHVFCCKVASQNDSRCSTLVGVRCSGNPNCKTDTDGVTTCNTLNLMDYYRGFDNREHFVFYQWKIIYENAR